MVGAMTDVEIGGERSSSSLLSAVVEDNNVDGVVVYCRLLALLGAGTAAAGNGRFFRVFGLLLSLMIEMDDGAVSHTNTIECQRGRCDCFVIV